MSGVADMFRLDGKRILITGASSGIGAHFALVAAGAGAEVVAAARREDRLAELAERIEATGGWVRTVAIDVTDAASCADALKEAGPLDILVNNAGVSNLGPAAKTGDDEWQRVIDTNLTGPFRLARDAMARNIAEGRPGVVVNVASILASRAAKSVAAYAASKAGIANLTRALALEWATKGIRVNALAPGYFVTEINEDALAGEVGDKIRRRIPMARFGELDDLTGPFLLLASDASRFMTGSLVTVDGGQSAGV